MLGPGHGGGDLHDVSLSAIAELRVALFVALYRITGQLYRNMIQVS
jgi:hypothetical protein